MTTPGAFHVRGGRRQRLFRCRQHRPRELLTRPTTRVHPSKFLARYSAVLDLRSRVPGEVGIWNIEQGIANIEQGMSKAEGSQNKEEAARGRVADAASSQLGASSLVPRVSTPAARPFSERSSGGAFGVSSLL